MPFGALLSGVLQTHSLAMAFPNKRLMRAFESRPSSIHCSASFTSGPSLRLQGAARELQVLQLRCIAVYPYSMQHLHVISHRSAQDRSPHRKGKPVKARLDAQQVHFL